MKRLLFFSALLLTTAVAAQDGGDWTPDTCHVTAPEPSAIIARDSAVQQPMSDVTGVSDVSQCPPGDHNQCGAHCIVDIKKNSRGDLRQVLKDAVYRCNTTVRLGPDVELDFSNFPLPIVFGRCVTLTSVSTFKPIHTQARTPRTVGPLLKYGEHREDTKVFLNATCADTDVAPSDHVRISGFRLFGPDMGQQSVSDYGIRVRRCLDVEISNMEIAGWGENGIVVENKPVDVNDPASTQAAIRINDFDHVRIHDNFIHHNQHPSIGSYAAGYGVNVTYWRAKAHIYRNVFDFNRHAIATDNGNVGGYVAEENLVLKGGGFHNGFWNTWTHQFDVHGTGDNGFGGEAGDEIRYDRNSFQYRKDNAIKIRGRPREGVYILRNVFAHEHLRDHWDAVQGVDAIQLQNEDETAHVESGDNENITNTDTFGEYGVCDFDADGIDDLFLATGATWWYSSSGKYHWSFLNTSSTRKKDLRFGYFDDDDRCDVLTESSASGRWLISSGGTGGWELLEPLQGGIERGFKAPLKDVVFGRFNPNDLSNARRTTHAFWRKENGAWYVTPLWNPDGWEYIGGSDVPMSKLRFGDFTGDGVTDVLAVYHGRWAISQSARTTWREINPNLGDPVAGLYIANMDSDDNIDDILRFQYLKRFDETKLIWSRSKNGVDEWRPFKEYSFVDKGTIFQFPILRFGFVGRFGAVSGGTLIVDQDRRGHFFSPAVQRPHDATEWTSLYPY